MSEHNDQMNDTEESNQPSGFSLGRRGILAASAAGLGIAGAGTTAAQKGGEGSENSPFADEDHDHSGGELGASDPVEALTAEYVNAGEIEATGGAVADLSTDVLTADHLSLAGSNRVDVVAEPDIDHEGDLSAELMSYLEDRDTNHLFVLPAGTYSWDTQFDQTDFEFLGVVGAPHATLEIGTHDPDYAFDLEGRRLLLQNFTVDITASETHDAGIVFAEITRRALIENIELQGERNYYHSQSGGKFTCRIDTVDEAGHSVIRNVRLPDGEVEDPDKRSVIPFAADPPHVGTNVWDGCFLQGWTSGFYVMNNTGRNVIQRCLTVDCNNFGIRLGRNDVCRDSRIVLSDATTREEPGMGLVLYGGSPLVENVRIDAPDVWNNVIWVDGEVTGGTVRDVDIYIGEQSPVNAIDIGRNVSLESRLLFENVSIFDESDGSPHPEHGEGFDYSVEVGNPNVTFRDCRFESPNRDGVRVIGGSSTDGVTIENCTFEAGGAALRFTVEGANHNVSNNRFSGDVVWDEPLSEVLWMGNRHDGSVSPAAADDWNVLANWGFDVEL